MGGQVFNGPGNYILNLKTMEGCDSTVYLSLTENEIINEKLDKGYKCKHCDMAGTEVRLMSDHVTMHTGHKSYCCNTCGMHFRFSSGVNMKMGRCTGERVKKTKQFKSNVQESKMHRNKQSSFKTTMSSSSLGKKSAISRPTTTWGYTVHKDPETSKYYSKNTVLGRTLYKCTECKYSANRILCITEHVTIHMQTENYTCNLCGKFFRYKFTIT